MRQPDHTPTCVALIPARLGSKRLPDKNIRVLKDHPLISYSITAAINSNIFSDVIVSTDSEKYAEIASYYGAEVPFLRPESLATDGSSDFEWIKNTLDTLKSHGRQYDCFCILRPTSPFRSHDTIRRAWELFLTNRSVDSLRAIEKCTQHPGKMWVVRGQRMYPLLPYGPEKPPWHSSPTQSLPVVYVQNASLEIAWTSVIYKNGSIAGETILPFITDGIEGFDINNSDDWMIAEELIRSREGILPNVTRKPFTKK